MGVTKKIYIATEEGEPVMNDIGVEAQNISGAVSVVHGGTGKTTISSGKALVGGAGNTYEERDIDTTTGGVQDSNALTTSGALYATKTQLQENFQNDVDTIMSAVNAVMNNRAADIDFTIIGNPDDSFASIFNSQGMCLINVAKLTPFSKIVLVENDGGEKVLSLVTTSSDTAGIMFSNAMIEPRNDAFLCRGCSIYFPSTTEYIGLEGESYLVCSMAYENTLRVVNTSNISITTTALSKRDYTKIKVYY